jgi:carbon monoxide dehydrogenase subunit G
LQIDNALLVPAAPEQAWAALLDVERLVPCMPGAILDSYDGDRVSGRMRVKLGPITVSYGETATFVIRDIEARRVEIQGSGKARTGTGTAEARITADLMPEGDRTRVVVATDMDITGRPEQFGRGLIASVAQNMVDRFATNLAATMAAGTEGRVPGTGLDGARAPSDGVRRGTGGDTAGAAPRNAASAGSSATEPDSDPVGVADLFVLSKLSRTASLSFAGLAVLAVLLVRARRCGGAAR